MSVDWNSLREGVELAGRDTFGRGVTYRPKGMAGISIRAQLRHNYAEADASGVAIESERTVLFVHLVDIAPHTPAHGDVIVDGCDRYEVTETQPQDGNRGDCRCSLQPIEA